MDGLLEDLPFEECTRLLRAGAVGRIAVIERGFPFVVPVNYRLVEASGRTWLAVRTRSGNTLDRASMHVAFELDGIDPAHQQGWSVLVRGTLHHVDPETFDLETQFDPAPWVTAARDVWLVIEPFAITGRRLRPPEFEWAFQARRVPLKSDHARVANALPAIPTPELSLVG